MTQDANGQPLEVGSRVTAWWDGYEYYGTVKAVSGILNEDGTSPLTVRREEDGAELPSTSGEVTVTPL